MQTGSERQRPPSPPWKIRTRPCPFYSSGRCLFSNACAFRHVIKSPLTPVDYNAVSDYASSLADEPYNILNNGEYDGDDGNEDTSPRDWARGAKSTPPVTGLHSREDSSFSYASTASRTETGTIRGVSQEDNAFVDESQIMGLGLTNLHEVRKPQTPVPMFSLASPPAQPIIGSKPHMSVSDPPFAFPARKPSTVITMPVIPPTPVRRTPSRTSSNGQELEVKPHKAPDFGPLATPGASSLLRNRSRKNTVSNQPPALVDEMGLLVPGADFSGSPTITLKRLAEANNPYINVDVQDESDDEPEQEPSPFLETPSIEYEDESPSRARQRFQKAYQLVTKELRQRVAHLRKDPVTPSPSLPPPTQYAQADENEVTIRGRQSSQSKANVTSRSANYLDDYLQSDAAEPALYEATEVSEPSTSSRAWLKPLRLSTLGGQLFTGTSQSSAMYSLDSARSSADAIPSTRSSSPVKRPLSSAFSRKSPQNSRQSSRKNTTESFASSNPMLASPFMDGGVVPPVPPIFTSPAVPNPPRSQRSGSIHYIHSPSPAKWTPSDTQPSTAQFPNSARSVSPTRVTRASPSPIEPTRRPSLRPKSVVPPPTPPLPTERPKLFFAIASTKPDEVARLLATGEASPNETVGPHDMHALTFAMENMANGDPAMLPQMEEVVATLLSYGADPNVLEDTQSKLNPSDQPRAGANPLVNYFLDKAHRSPIPTQPSNAPNEDEIPLRRAKFAIVGQEFGLLELARAYAAHSRLARFLVDEEDDAELPFVAIFAGLSGHGKTLLASKVGGLLGVPSYTVNTTLIKGYSDLWSAPSCHTRQSDEHTSLREFLHAHDRQRVVVVIDEIEKIHDSALLQSLLVPWETGRLREGTFSRTIDISRTIWLCTSNIGSQEIIRSLKQVQGMDNGSFDMLAKQTRSNLREVLGASLIARVSTVVPFLPFSAEERLAISSKCLSALRHKLAHSRQTSLPKVGWDGVLEKAANEYVEAEGARSIRRSILRLVDGVLHGV